MSLTDTRHLSVVIGGKSFVSDNIKAVHEQCVMFSEEAFGIADPAKATLNLIKAGVELAPLMTRGDVEKTIAVLRERMLARSRT